MDVKAAADSKSWPMHDFNAEKGHFIVFVRFGKNKSASQHTAESYVLSSRELRSWAKEHDGFIRIQDLARTVRDAREAWDRLLPAA